MFHEAFESALDELETAGYDQEAESWSGEGEGVFGEAEEMELAAELLTVTNEQELDHFLGGLIRKVTGGKGVRGLFSALGGALKPIAKQALPAAGGAIGGYFGGARGASLGSQAGSLVGNALGLELESMSAEDREFEVARRVVRIAGTAANHAAAQPPGTPPMVAARRAVTAAARQVAPALLAPARRGTAGAVAINLNGGAGSAGAPESGRWYRKNGRLVLVGV